jgi:hypothetical protein
MKVGRWTADKIFMTAKDAALEAIRAKAEEIKFKTQQSITNNTNITRAPRFSDQLQNVSFTPKKGKNKNSLVAFKARVWLGRKPGDLRSTVRVVEKPDRKGNVRVIAGNFKIYWARFSEAGVPSRNIPRSMNMRGAFAEVKSTVAPEVAKRVKEALR